MSWSQRANQDYPQFSQPGHATKGPTSALAKLAGGGAAKIRSPHGEDQEPMRDLFGLEPSQIVDNLTCKKSCTTSEWSPKISQRTHPEIEKYHWTDDIWPLRGNKELILQLWVSAVLWMNSSPSLKFILVGVEARLYTTELDRGPSKWGANTDRRFCRAAGFWLGIWQRFCLPHLV